ncbi:hypothetical protein P7C73_g2331, partial [Tremellales sp. Uapishka_1]
MTTSSPHISTGSPISSPADDERLRSLRRETNLRSVSRNDPSVKDIIETSVYSTIYHYEEASNKWVKQKMEGSLFIVRRDKAPEYALFMLNRQTVKNPIIPLVPGEMKLTVVDKNMLQVSRRKQRHEEQKTPIGIWFSEGSHGLERFKSAILRICGEPSARPATGGASSPLSPALVPAPTTTDGFSRLFAGIINSTPAALPQAPPQTQRTTQITTTTTTMTTQNTLPLPPAPRKQSPPALFSPVPPVQLIAPPAIEPESQFEPISSAPLTKSIDAPGQTVDDLLMSILGLAPQMPHHAPSAVPHPSHTELPQHAHPPPPPAPVPEINHKPRMGRVGDASFAQATQSFSPPVQVPQPVFPAPSHPPHHTALPTSVQERNPPHLHQAQRSTPANNYTTPHTNSFLASASKSTHSNGMMHEIEPNPMRNATVDGMMRRTFDGRGKVEWVNRLLELIHTDERFVDDIWKSYLERSGSTG